MIHARESLKERVFALIDRLASGGRDDEARDALLCDIASWQAEHVESYRRLLVSKTRSGRPKNIREWPALPTDVFRYTRVAVHPATQDIRTFRTSGTSTEIRGAHSLRDLSLYDRAAQAAARYALFPDVDRMPLVVFAADERDAPSSSLSYMLSRFAVWFGTNTSVFVLRGSALLLDRAAALLHECEREGTPVALLGTSFAFVHAENAWGGTRFRLPYGSRIMQTGGFKGLTREIEPDAMRGLLAARYGVDEPWIIAEYGMTELSSQMYENTLRDEALALPKGPRHLWVPGWMRAEPVDPEHLAPVQEGATGILRIDDAANLDTACSVQTSDLAQRGDDGLRLLGRAKGAPPRGCSLAADAALGGRHG